MRLDVRGRNFDPAAKVAASLHPDELQPSDSQSTTKLQPTSDEPVVAAADLPDAAQADPTVAGHIGSDGPFGISHSVDALPPTSPSPGQKLTDEQLLSAYRAGDRASFDTLVKRYERELFHFLLRFMGNRSAADDAFQETFLQVYQSADSFDPTRHFRPWLFTIAANKARDLLRSQSRRSTTPLQSSINPNDKDGAPLIDLLKSSSAAPSEPLEELEMRDLVHQTIAGMPEHLREIVLLSYFHQFPYKTISDILGIPLGTVKSRLHAAVAFFAHRWNALHRPEPK